MALSPILKNELMATFAHAQQLIALLQEAAAALPAAAVDTDGTLAADSDSKVPSQKAVAAYVAAHAGGGGLGGTPTFADNTLSGAALTSGSKDGGGQIFFPGTSTGGSFTPIFLGTLTFAIPFTSFAAVQVSLDGSASAHSETSSVVVSTRNVTASSFDIYVTDPGSGVTDQFAVNYQAVGD